MTELIKNPSEYNHWIPIFNRLNLSRSEKATVDRFKKNPTSRVFLPIAEILKKHALEDESLELLMAGVKEHPRYNAARVMLADQLFQRFMFQEAWLVLEDSLENLKDNHYAQNIRLKTALILGKEFETKETANHLKRRNLLSIESNELIQKLQTIPFNELHSQYYKSKSIAVNLATPQTMNENSTFKDQYVSIKNEQANDYISNLSETFLNSLKSNHRMNLREFAKFCERESFNCGESNYSDIDDLTLAKSYENRGLYEKALSIYRLKIKAIPEDSYLSSKINQLLQLIKKQNSKSDLEKPPRQNIGDKIAIARAYDQKIAYLKEFLPLL